MGTQPSIGHWPDLHQPPMQFPTAEIQAVINRVRGTETDNVRAAYAASVVVGYGITQLPHEHPVMASDTPITKEEGLAILESMVKGNKATGAVGALPWASILAFVLPLLLEWLKNR